MTTLVGRDDELARIGDALASARAARVATALKVTGDPGAGKTALFHRIAEDAAAANWLASAVDCHRIQSGLPFVTARRIAQSFVDQLGDQRERYAGGLDEALKDAASVGEALLRLTEGLLLDFSVLVAIDDAQWMDAESRELLDQLMRSFSDRPLALALIERSDEPGPLDVPAVTHNIALQRLTPCCIHRTCARVCTRHRLPLVRVL
ncbi:MAG: ATP-binding protein, partial [Candidatus Eremiobacteraeota bacterium]|nr:ATP-binding protein [Candidatus Eremiobacteraeota bacterium]